jgi:hypothetical protein
LRFGPAPYLKGEGIFVDVRGATRGAVQKVVEERCQWWARLDEAQRRAIRMKEENDA